MLEYYIGWRLYCIASVHLYSAIHTATTLKGTPSGRDLEKIKQRKDALRLPDWSNERVTGGSLFHREGSRKADARALVMAVLDNKAFRIPENNQDSL